MLQLDSSSSLGRLMGRQSVSKSNSAIVKRGDFDRHLNIGTLGRNIGTRIRAASLKSLEVEGP